MAKLNSYAAGYRAGLEQSKKIVTSDIESLYSAACIVLHDDFGFGQKRLEKFLLEVQDIWNNIAPTGKTVKDVCMERTGICLDQIEIR